MRRNCEDFLYTVRGVARYGRASVTKQSIIALT